MSKARLELKSYRVSEIERFLADRRFAVPEIQREFVWDPKKACKLLDSIYHELPIGTIMLWETHRKNRHHLREHLHVLPEFDGGNKHIWFLLDGQQRVAVLFQAHRGDLITLSNGKQINFERLCFSLEAENGQELFVYRRPVAGRFVSVRDILAPRWKKNFRNLAQYKLKRLEKCRILLRRYKVPLLFIRTNRLEEVRESFIRINALGTPVSAADRAFARASAFDMRHLVRQAKMGLAVGFQDLPDFAVLLAMAFMQGERGDVGERPVMAAIRKLEIRVDASKSALSQFTKEWTRLRSALGKAVDYFRSNFSVLNRGFLPSDNMLIVFTMFLYWNRGLPNATQKKEVRRWFWSTAIGQRYSGRGHRANILKDLEFFERMARKGVARFRLENRVHKSDLRRLEFTTRSSRTNAFLCLLLRQGPRYIENGDPIPLENISARANVNQKHHIFPRARLRSKGFSSKEYNSLCNICFIVAEENQSIGKRPPCDYLTEAWEDYRHFCKVMKSHLIPADDESGIWDEDIRRGYRRFVRQRLDLICAALEKEAGIKLFQED